MLPEVLLHRLPSEESSEVISLDKNSFRQQRRQQQEKMCAVTYEQGRTLVGISKALDDNTL